MANTKNLSSHICFNTNMPSIFDTHINYSLTDLDGIITDVSTAFSKETGYPKEELIGKSHALLRSPDFPIQTYAHLWETIVNNKIWEGQIKNIRKNGDAYWMHSIIQPYFNELDEKIGYIAIRQNITKEKQCEALSMIDELTGVYNRRKFNQELNKQLINYYRYQENFSLVMIDIDYFKYLNDTYGHMIGDEALKRLCEVVRQHIRAGDFFARWGGEEFVLILHHIDKDMAYHTCTKLLGYIQNELSGFLFENFGITLNFTCSMGITSAQITDSTESILERSDTALYHAKENGRNRIELL